MEIDPFIFRLSIFILSIFIGYFVVWSVTPSLHTPLMSVTNAISSVIIVGAIIASFSSSGGNISFSNILGFLAVILAAINIFGGFLVTQRMLQMYKKKKKRKINNVSQPIFNFIFNNWSSIYTSASRPVFT
jgi:NAD(P) transhydrogenase subunit alpha